MTSFVLHLQKLLSRSTAKPLFSDPYTIFCLLLSLAGTTYFGLISLDYAFSGPFVVQDDARQHVFWMQQFTDPQLFPNDLIADYFRSVAPAGYTALYQAIAQMGIEPLVLAKLLPLVLGLITSSFCFGVCLELFPVPAGALITTLVVNQSLWLKDDLISATPRAFLYPLFFGFLYYLLKGSLVPCLIAIALQGLFYPQFVLLELAILTIRLFRWRQGRPRLSQERTDYLFWLTGCGVALLVLLPFALETSKFGPVVTAAQAQAMPEFAEGGRSRFFVNSPIEFWLAGDSGIRPPAAPWILWISLLLPIWLKHPWLLVKHQSVAVGEFNPRSSQISKQIVLLLQILGASIGLFLLAHASFLKLHLPSRYTEHSLRIVMALAAGITLTLLLNQGLRRLIQQRLVRFSEGPETIRPEPQTIGLPLRQRLAVFCTGLFAVGIFTVPAIPAVFLPPQGHVVGKLPQLYDFLLQQPKDVLIASLTEEVNDLPTFAKRSILVGREYGIPYHLGYYNQIRQRATDLVAAQYSPTIAAAQNLIRQYGVDFFLLDRGALAPIYIADSSDWMRQFEPAASEALAQLQQGKVPALFQLIDRCSVLEVRNFVLLQADCIGGVPLK